jgi:serine/threonine-protein kinase
MTLTAASLIEALRRCALLNPVQLEAVVELQARFAEPRALAGELIRRGWLSAYQVNQIFQGRGPELVLGSYVLLERLGEGGMGKVFKARHRRLGTVVALKVIRKERVANQAILRRFQREVRAIAQLDHPNIIRALDADEVDGTPFLVMEYVEGADLGGMVRKSGPLPLGQACDCIRQAALGLQHAHERGLVHRDIKPSNLLLSSAFVIKILDMGLARLHRTAEDESSAALTAEGLVMGTMDYIAPEQAMNSHAVDIRADLYSLGCTLYYLLTGRVPFPGCQGLAKLLKHRIEEPEPIQQLRPEVPPTVAAVVRKLMAKRPEERFQTPAEVAAALSGGPASGRLSPDSTPKPTVVEIGQEAATQTDTLASALAYMAQGGPPGAAAVAAGPAMPAPASRVWLAVVLGGVLLLVLVVLLVAWYAWPTPAPPAAAVPAKTQRSKPAPPVDLLRLIDPARDSVKGRWSFQGQILLSPREKNSVLQIPYAPPEEYDLEVVAARQEGADMLGVGLVAGGRQFLLHLDGWPLSVGGPFSGIDALDHKRALANETTYHGRLLVMGKPTRIICAVRRKGITASCDGRVIVRWEGDFKRLSLSPQFTTRDRDRLFLTDEESVFRITRIALRPHPKSAAEREGH